MELELELVIDTREHWIFQDKYKEQLEKLNIKYTCKQLDVGDFVFRFKENTDTDNMGVEKTSKDIIIIERKTVDDYVSSIKSKRLHNQRIRLKKTLEENPSCTLIYLLEGDVERETFVRNSIIHCIIRDKIYYMNSSSMDKTFDVLVEIWKTVCKNPEFYSGKVTEINNDSHFDYLKNVKLEKKDNITTENCFILQLSQIPGISITMAKKIQEKYKNIHDLFAAYKLLENENNAKKQENMLTCIQSLGKKTSKKVYDYMWNSS